MKSAKIVFPALFAVFTLTFSLTNCSPKDTMVKQRTLNSAALAQDYTDLIAKANDAENLTTTNSRIALGRVLFYDVALSRNNAVACGSCHKQQFAFADNVAKSKGFQDFNAKRNSPPIQNINQVHRLFWDGRADSVRQLVFMPIQDHIEMGFEQINLLPAKLAAIEYYPALFQAAFGSTAVTQDKIGIAISDFIRVLRSDGSKFDQLTADGIDFNQQVIPGLGASENLGFRTFIGKGRCNSCHRITSGGGSGNFGHSYGESQPNGNSITSVGTNTGLDMVYADQGEGARTGLTTDEGLFLIPGLRNVALTAPYMHDGRFKTLMDVIEFYDNGVKPHPNLSLKLRNLDAVSGNPFLMGIVQNMNDAMASDEFFTEDGMMIAQANLLGPVVPKKLGLTAEEKQGLIDFLRTFTDPAFVNDQRLAYPFVVSYN